MSGFTHFDQEGNAVMVDVTEKSVTKREAIARGTIQVNEEVFAGIQAGTMGKGDVLGVARTAGIMAAKRTFELIPLCHILMLTKCEISFRMIPEELKVEVTSLVRTEGKTGVEMEALTGASVALLTIYDMCKALDKKMVIGEVRLVQKTGGKSGAICNEPV